MALELRKRVFELLAAKPDQKYKAREIASWICDTYPAEAQEKLVNSTFIQDQTALINQLVAEIGANRPNWEKRYPELRSTETRPRQFYWTQKTEHDEVVEAEASTRTAPESEKPVPGEHSLYPSAINFLSSEYGVKAFRIDERKSSNAGSSGSNRWLYPDIVGLQSLAQGLNAEVAEAIRASSDRKVKLWSVEVKVLLNRSNVREAYYQSVSNSSWANLGYLAATEIEGAGTLDELRILFGMHGIGLIKLDPENPSEGEILIPARERLEVEWAMCSRLANENPDFRTFIKKVRHFFQTGDL
ncbi:HrgA protein [Bradyrhizobium sp. MOS001]|uniref:HrgA protein n=1 Tax=Bradyrhizobium sp. MOS001 TaxID=2133948 RepID=UPI001074AF69|nr:HrgA protein [Bradyrhizobium sp. MOS001]TFW51796.1 HrgA protein [Bradyrhizobium sp. MOS001]